MDNKKIEIFYRGVYYPLDCIEKDKNRPEWFLYEKILNNLISSIDKNICHINFIYDIYRSPSIYIPNEDHITIKSGTDQGAFFELMKILESKNFNPEAIIYIVENDYLHKPGWCEILLEGFEIGGDYVTLYDHPDKYTDYHDLKSEIMITKSVHWRTIPSTTNTFAVKYKTLMEDMNLHAYYAEFGIQGRAHDTTKFIDLTNKGRKIISCIPGYSTHCNNYLSPTINWEQYV